MTTKRLIVLGLTLLAFSANSIFCRIAFRENQIDAATFTFIRLLSGAVALWFIVNILRRESERRERERPREPFFRRIVARPPMGSWLLATFLFIYAATFSFAYTDLNAATGGLILFGCVQATMVVMGIVRGEKPSPFEWSGLLVALVGLVILFLPKFEPPPLLSGSLMAIAGVSWGLYSIYGKGSVDPTITTAGNFARAVPLGLVLFLATLSQTHATPTGLFWAVLSGAVTSGLGYVLWYESLKWLSPTRAAVSQLSVPLIVALAGATFLGEQLTWALLTSGLLIVAGAMLAIIGKSRV